MNDLPEPIDPSPAEAEAASASAAAPRRRAPRKTAAAAAPEAVSAAAAEPTVEATPVAPAKAPRRRSPARDTSPIELAAAAAAESLAAPVMPSAEPAAEPAEDTKPARAPRKRKSADAVEAVAEVVIEPVIEPVVEPVVEPASEPVADLAADPAPKRPRSRKPVAEVATQDAAEPPAVTIAPTETAPAVSADAGEGGEGAQDGEASADDQGPTIPSDRNARRRERRNRRDRDRPRGNAEDGGAVAAAGASGAVDAAGESVDAGEPAVVAEPVDAGELFAEVLSGQFDVEVPEEVAAEPTKRVLRPEPEAPKLHKVLAQSGVGSRRDMEQLIQDGQVTVNGEVAHVGMRIAHGDQIKIAGRPVKVRIAPGPARILAYHKPVGEVVTHHDPEGRPTVFRGLPRLPSGKWLSVGRLDINTEGLLLFTSSGELANQLMHPRFGVEREYAVRVLGKLEEGDRAQLLEGVDVDGQRAAFKAIADGGGEGVNHWYRVIIAEGRNREVRKLFDAVGLTVSRLIRIRYGTVVLPRGLKRGVWVELGEDDVRAIRRLAHAPRDGQGQGQAQVPREPQGDAPSNLQGQPQQGRGQQGQQGQRGQQPGKGPRGPNGQAGQQAQGGPNGRQGGPQGQGQGQGQGKQRGKHGGKPGFGGQGGQGGPGGQGGNFEQRRPDARADMRPPRVEGPRADVPRDDRDDRYDDDIPTHIPNPLEQTFDRRFATGSKRISAGFGRPTEEPVGGRGNGPRKSGGPREPDPLQTSVGYIGADAYFSKPGGGGGKNRGGGGRRR